MRSVLTLATWCIVASAHASPRSDPTSGRAVFTGAATPPPTSISLSPAAIGLGPFDEIYLAIAGAIDQLHIALDRVDASGARSDGPAGPDVAGAPRAMIAGLR